MLCCSIERLCMEAALKPGCPWLYLVSSVGRRSNCQRWDLWFLHRVWKKAPQMESQLSELLRFLASEASLKVVELPVPSRQGMCWGSWLDLVLGNGSGHRNLPAINVCVVHLLNSVLEVILIVKVHKSKATRPWGDTVQHHSCIHSAVLPECCTRHTTLHFLLNWHGYVHMSAL